MNQNYWFNVKVKPFQIRIEHDFNLTFGNIIINL